MENLTQPALVTAVTRSGREQRGTNIRPTYIIHLRSDNTRPLLYSEQGKVQARVKSKFMLHSTTLYQQWVT